MTLKKFISKYCTNYQDNIQVFDEWHASKCTVGYYGSIYNLMNNEEHYEEVLQTTVKSISLGVEQYTSTPVLFIEVEK